MELTQEDYERMQNQAGFKIGDKVVVMRVAEKGELGWTDCEWISEMDERIHKVSTIKNIDRGGITLAEIEPAWRYPYFVLEHLKDEKAYMEGHKNSGLRVGDNVRVNYAATSHLQGWTANWAEDMNNAVGDVYPIIQDMHDKGFRLGGTYRSNPGDGFNFPYYVLEKVSVTKLSGHRKVHHNYEKYANMHNAECDLVKGDLALLLRTAYSYEGGWKNSWAPQLNPYIEHVGTVLLIDKKQGVMMNFNGIIAYVPYFVLIKIRT